MTTRILFNTDKKLKQAAQKKARKEGLTLSAVLNLATEAYVSNRLEITAFDSDLTQARKEVREGKGISQEELFKKLGL
ncbi:MAG: hypothetical protein G01um101456_458 [Parcubacteria group bacterium Gr01-1014_56]|nr:MAG: hypothetical protein G01um101456_458 [Parcubacteria group bacterium Gr01-1014_56]